MSSLCPGTLFSFPGFNKKSTPVPPQTTSEELSKRYRRYVQHSVLMLDAQRVRDGLYDQFKGGLEDDEI